MKFLIVNAETNSQYMSVGYALIAITAEHVLYILELHKAATEIFNNHGDMSMHISVSCNNMEFVSDESTADVEVHLPDVIENDFIRCIIEIPAAKYKSLKLLEWQRDAVMHVTSQHVQYVATTKDNEELFTSIIPINAFQLPK